MAALNQRRGLRSAIALAVIGGSAWACAQSTLSVGGELSLEITSNSPVSVADSVVITYDAVGRSLSGLVLDFGDSSVDSLSFFGAQSAGGRVSHLYGSSGEYSISAHVVDAIQGSLTKQLAVTVNPSH